jgi:hypothetical protein
MRFAFLGLCCLFFVAAHAQLTPTEPDNSPMDMCYSPYAYPILKFQSRDAPAMPNARVVYSRPQRKGRQIFGDQVKYNELWRLGANETTELELFKAATIGGKKVAKGRYSLFCIPQPDSWTIIINKDLHSWGAFSYKPQSDLARFQVPVQKTDAPTEYFTIFFDNNNTLNLMWEHAKVQIPFVFAPK